MIKSTENNSFELSFTQCKQLIENGVDIRDFLAKLNNQPYFLETLGVIDSISELQAIIQGGCESGAYMPAVTYANALDAMGKHSTDIEFWASQTIEEIVFNPSEDTFSGLATKLCSAAVENWVNQFFSDLDGVDWD